MSGKPPIAVRASAIRQYLWRKAGPYYNLALREGLTRVFPPAASHQLGQERTAHIVGLLSTATGIGQSARLCAAELRRCGYSITTSNLSRLFGADTGVAHQEPRSGRPNSSGLAVYHLNPPLLLLGMLAAGPRRYYRGPNVAYWAWEVPELPPEWIVALRYVDAVLVPSTFCREIIARHSDKPVIVVPHPVTTAELPLADSTPRPAANPFRVLSIFNCGSSLIRKNPAALIDAFKLAFGNDRDVELVLKISDGRQHKYDVAALEARIGTAPNIRIVDQLMTPSEIDQLFRSADVYASMHRSEGFGLSVAEAILRDVPVVVTDWAGTVDFCPPELAYTVAHALVPVDDPHPAYCNVRASLWAEPSIEDAARQLSAIRSDPVAARERARKLKARLRAHIESHSYATALDRLRSLLGSNSAT